MPRPREPRGGGPYGEYFGALNEALKAARIGGPVALVDLDRLDRNVDAIAARLPSAGAYRVVEKSLPSLGLLRYVCERAGTRKLMVFHAPFLELVLSAFEPGVDVLFGKPMPAQACELFFARASPELRERAQREVRWLVDGPALLERYRELAAREGLRLRVSVEIDVGLHRGGLASPGELGALLDIIAADPERLAFAGLMGYDGHAGHAPAVFRSAASAAAAAFAASMAEYGRFVEAGRASHPGLFAEDPSLCFNSGGSSTYGLFGRAPFVNDVSVGGAALRPSAYPAHAMEGLEPALFVASPILKRSEGLRIPFAGGLSRAIGALDPRRARSYCVYGGGWGAIAAPAGLRGQLLGYDDPPNQNVLANQYILNGPREGEAAVGDFVFWRPAQSDELFLFEDIMTFRGGAAVGGWKSFQRGI